MENTDVIATSIELMKKEMELPGANLASMVPLFQHRGKPMSLKLHFQLAPMYKLDRPKFMVFQLARQLGKSFTLCEMTILLAGLMNGFNILVLQPRKDQIQRLNNTIFVPLLRSFVLKDSVIQNKELAKFLSKVFISGSTVYMDYSFLNPDRIRGISGVSMIMVDEAQDVDNDTIPVIQEVMSAEIEYGFLQFTGTPKTTDGTLSFWFDLSSQAEWVIPCSCGRKNIPTIDQHIMKMIQKKGCSCYKCGRLLDARKGGWVHAFPSRMSKNQGYHLPQIVHPIHYAFEQKWEDILYKQQNYTQGRFYNEVLGIPFDESVRLLTVKDLQKASNGLDGSLERALKLRSKYESFVAGVDWSGGGELGHSYTVITMVGFRAGTDVLDCVYAERIPLGLNPEEEAKKLLTIINAASCTFMAHDYGGAGYIRESIMRQAGLPQNQIIPFTYTFSSRQEIIVYNAPKRGVRYSYSIDKARSLAVLTAMIRLGKITLPDYDKVSGSSANSFLDDLLNLVEAPKELPRGDMAYLITHKPNKPDDFAHALNYACSAIWYTRQAYPNIAEVQKFKLTEDQLKLAPPDQRDWSTS